MDRPTIGQYLAKASDTDYDTQWVTGSGGGTTYDQGNGISIEGTTISVRLSQTQGNGLIIGPDGGLWGPEGGGTGGITLQSIAITTPPDTTTYTAGQVFDNTGMVVTAYYNFGLSDVVTGYTVSPSGVLTGDVTEITVSYSEGGVLKTATQPVTVTRQNATITLLPAYIDLDADNPTGTAQISYNGDGALSISNGNPSLVTAELVGQTVQVTSISETPDSVAITVSAPQTGIYNAAQATLTANNYVTTQIYGALWEGTSDPAWSRTGAAELFPDPEPAVNNGTGSSPFDNIMPWAGMTRVTDPVAGEMVQTPKFWYKWTRSGASMQLQIANGAQEGFFTSPAHADRGDGQGERDIVYVGRYHCGSDYKSTTGVPPLDQISRATARDAMTALGDEYWQYDFSMWWTINMLYLVEFANWNSQSVIGYGCSPAGKKFNVGLTDAMEYHTGTSASSRETYGCCQYRNIEGLLDNVNDWCDGIYFAGTDVYCINNPSEFSDSENGIKVGERPQTTGYVTTWAMPNINGFEYALYPDSVGGDESTFVCDECFYQGTGVVARASASYTQSQVTGMFCLYGVDSANAAVVGVGCRNTKLPNGGAA